MLEALKGLPKGGICPVLYVLPPFARQRLYTFPLPPAAGEPEPNCHWSTFNFFNVKPDDRFFDSAECDRYLGENYYKIVQPGVYGDLVLFFTDKDIVRHSAVYLADDLVFTKNGNNYVTPWIIMRLADLHGGYANCKMVCFRRKVD
jgi:hypothetical protein